LRTTTTHAGLAIKAKLDKRAYPTGIKIRRGEFKTINLPRPSTASGTIQSRRGPDLKHLFSSGAVRPISIGRDYEVDRDAEQVKTCALGNLARL
jgi:hypothetical protein